MADWYMVGFVLFIGILIGAVIMTAIKPETHTMRTVREVIDDVYDNTPMPESVYQELIKQIEGVNTLTALEVLQDVSIKRGRREAIEEVLNIINEVAKDDLIDDAIKINSVRNRVEMWLKGGEHANI